MIYTIDNLNRFISLLDSNKVLVSVDIIDLNKYIYIELVDAQEGHIFDVFETEDISSYSIKEAITWIALTLA